MTILQISDRVYPLHEREQDSMVLLYGIILLVVLMIFIFGAIGNYFSRINKEEKAEQERFNRLSWEEQQRIIKESERIRKERIKEKIRLEVSSKLGVILIFSLLMLIVFFVYIFRWYGVILGIILISSLYFAIRYYNTKYKELTAEGKSRVKNKIPVFIGFILILISIIIIAVYFLPKIDKEKSVYIISSFLILIGIILVWRVYRK